MRGLARAALVGAVLLAGCGKEPLPTTPVFATGVEMSSAGGNTAFIVTPWPFDSSVAFLCSAKPGDEFSAAHPAPAESAGCVALDVSAADDRLTASFSSASLTPQQAGRFRASRAAYLAVAGSRGPISGSAVLTVLLGAASPAPS